MVFPDTGRNIPFNSQILDLAILIIQRLEDTVHSSRSSVIVVVKKVWLPGLKNSTQVVQRHKSIVGIGIVEFG